MNYNYREIKEIKIMIRALEKSSTYISKIIFKDSQPIPIGIVVPKHENEQIEALEEADQWFTEDNALELWAVNWNK